jgi:hypothetical protein
MIETIIPNIIDNIGFLVFIIMQILIGGAIGLIFYFFSK